MDRRKFLVSIGGASIGGSVLVGSGAFSAMQAERAVAIDVSEDPDALIGLDSCPESDNARYSGVENGMLYVDISEEPNEGDGVNPNSLYWFDNVFEICNQSDHSICLWVERDDEWPETEVGDPRVDFYLGDDPEDSILGPENAYELDSGECVCIGIHTNTLGLGTSDVDTLLEDVDNDISLRAHADCPDPVDDEPPEEVPGPEPTTFTSELGTGGPAVVMGLDSEWDPSDDTHGTREDHEDMVESILDDVANGGDGILVLGASSGATTYWENLGEDVEENVTFVTGDTDIAEQSFEGFKMIGVASSNVQVSGGLTDQENSAIIDRRNDVADFVNEGGGLLGKTQDGLSNDWEYVDPLASIEAKSASNDSIIVTDEGEALGLTQNGMDGWCCYHEVFVEESIPAFFDVLLRNPEQSDDPPSAIGGEEVLVPTEISLTLEGPANVEVNDTVSYEFIAENVEDDPGENVAFRVEISRSGGIDENDVELEDDAGNELPLTEDGDALVGTFPDDDGVELAGGESVGATVNASMSTTGSYSVSITAVGVDSDTEFSAIEDGQIECLEEVEQ